MRRLLFALTLACAGAAAQPLALPAPPRAGLDQHVGAQVPLDVTAVDEEGRPQTLARFVDGSRPVLLVPGYYRCRQLCGLVMHGLLDALQASGAAPGAWRIVGIGIDPRETPADAHARRDADLAYAKSADLHLLTLAPPALRRVTQAIGFHFQPIRGEDGAGAVAHPATVVLLTPHGRVSRYFNGVGIDAGQMRVALADAAGDRLGGVSARLALLCAHFDPHAGRLNAAVMDGIRAMAALLVAALAGWCWRRRAPREEGR